MKVLHYDAFTTVPNKGNPAGVVLDAPRLSDSEMQKIAAKVGFNETAFICPSDKADLKLKYFTPGHEMNLCGHGTVGALVAAYENKLLTQIHTIETKAGILNISLESHDGTAYIRMAQSPAHFVDFTGDVIKLAKAIGIGVPDIDDSYPIVYGNTGIWTLLVPIKHLSTFKRMKPSNKDFPSILNQYDHASIHPFCLDTYHKVEMHGRHFSSAYSGTIEDPATGTASGVMGAYWLKYIDQKDSINMRIEQGQEIDKDAIIDVMVQKSGEKYLVEIGGTAIYVKDIEIRL
ncbi:PhzF family phenazine biosynthesis isomerase [Spirochaeta cellobiosiphila]|uniref:PhzF family phenazine biosynthesis isomerase n=1 Tax=Spirochaeta cellobiosiphila TaxID=504483 RepID=UPI00041115FC|nr:PhzF family phenazine biosynthesis isomerase [Spirochaeta cellobiosiphila]